MDYSRKNGHTKCRASAGYLGHGHCRCDQQQKVPESNCFVRQDETAEKEIDSGTFCSGFVHYTPEANYFGAANDEWLGFVVYQQSNDEHGRKEIDSESRCLWFPEWRMAA